MSDKHQDSRQTPIDAAAMRKRAEEQAGTMEQSSLSSHTPEEIQRILHELRVHQIQLEMQNEELRVAQALIEAGRARYVDLYDLAPVGYCTISEKGIILETNLTLTTMLGMNRRRMIKKPFSAFILKEDQDIYYLFRKKLFETGEPQTCEFHMVRSNKTAYWASLQATVIQDEDGTKCLRVTISDFSKQKRAQQELRESEELFKTTLLSVGDGVISTDVHGNVLIMNKISEQLTGWTQEEAEGKHVVEVFNIINEITRERYDNPVQKALEKGYINKTTNHTLLISKDGTERPIEDNAAPILDHQNNISGVVLVFRDITEKKKNQDEIKYLSFHDHLTGLYNRRYFDEELKRLDAKRNWPLTIVMGDINGLKLINDSFGHAAGDQLLVKTTEAIKNGCRTDDIIARIGGDEFAILLPKTDEYEAVQLIKRVKGFLKNERVGDIEISISLGYETKNSEAVDIEDIFKKAEDTMYHNKLFEGSRIRGKIIDSLVEALNNKSKREETHSKHVSELSVKMGIALGLEEDKIKELKTLGLLHDIGKIAISESILNKLGKLTENEWIEMKSHAEIGYRILNTNNDMTEIAKYVLAHHERWDGKGYPKGLKGEAIPLELRIIAIAEAYDAMVSKKSYHPSLTKADALAELRTNAGTQFDPELVKAFVDKVLCDNGK